MEEYMDGILLMCLNNESMPKCMMQRSSLAKDRGQEPAFLRKDPDLWFEKGFLGHQVSSEHAA